MESAAAMSLATAARGAETPLVFGVVADPQYADIEPKGTRFYRNSPAKIRAAVAEFNRRGVAFVLNLGDTIDRDFASFDAALDAFRTLEAPVRHLVGNHDFEVNDARKGDVIARLGLKERYASFARGGIRVLCACHYPVWPDDAHALFNAAEIRARLAKRREVAAWFAGHDHKGGFGAFDGVPCLTFHGLVETADTNAFAVVAAYADRLDIAGFGREPSRTIRFRT